jgi:toxin-antitoxin system PIN domain toxin
VIAIDTNILVYAHRADSPWHAEAAVVLRTAAEGRASWAIPWPCLHEFLAIVTHSRIYDPPSSLAQAVDQVDAWLESPTVELISETGSHWPALKSQLVGGRVIGPMVHDARVAAVCIRHGVTEFWSADRDFSRFPDLRCRNPLLRT